MGCYRELFVVLLGVFVGICLAQQPTPSPDVIVTSNITADYDRGLLGRIQETTLKALGVAVGFIILALLDYHQAVTVVCELNESVRRDLLSNTGREKTLLALNADGLDAPVDLNGFVGSEGGTTGQRRQRANSVAAVEMEAVL